MAIAQKAVAYIEMDEFLALENASAYRHEYLDGAIYVRISAHRGRHFRLIVDGISA